MKKTLLAATVVAFAGFGTAAFAGDYDLDKACHDAVDAGLAAAIEAGTAPADTAPDYTGCTCIMDGTNDDITASFEEHNGKENANELWSDDAKALVAQCFPAPEAPEGADAG